MNKQVLIAFLTGAALGGVMALLYAPQSGERTRRDIRRFAEDGQDKIMDAIEDIKDKYAEIEDKVKDFRDCAKAAK